MGIVALDFLFVRACRAHFNRASELFAPLDLQRSWPAVLQELEIEEGLDQTELARRLEVTPATMTNLLNRMEAAGMVTRSRGQRDSRISNVYLSEAGRAKLKAITQTVSQMEEMTFNGFSAAEKAQLREYLERMHKNLLKNKD